MTDHPRILALFGSVVLFGAERANLEALTALRDHGCEVLCLICDVPWNTHIPPALEARGLRWIKVPYIDLRPGSLQSLLFRNPIVFLQSNVAFLRAYFLFRPTHIHAFNQLYVLNFLLGLMLTRVPMIFRAGDEPTLHNCVWWANWRFVIWRTTRFVANAKFVANSLIESGVSEELITLIYNRPPERFPSRESPLNVIFPDDSRIFLYIGQIAEHKGPHVLVEAFRRIIVDDPHARLLLAGRISDWVGDSWARQLRDQVAQDPLIKQRVTFLGEISDVSEVFAKCEVLVVPSLFADPSPNVVMEAKKAGRAAIVFPRGGLAELITDGVDGLICNKATVDELVVAMQAYLDDRDLARRHGEAAAKSLELLDIPLFADKWVRVYKSA